MPTQENESEENEIDTRRLFRREIMICDADLRLDVGRQLVRNVLGNETITLDSKEVGTKGDATVKRGGRERTVTGSYSKTIDQDDTYAVGFSITEMAKTGVISKMAFECESIVGGAYINTLAGATLKTCAWSDFLCWGGWLEADVTRIEITALAIRSYTIYNHAIGARIVMCGSLVDDYQVRNETIGVLVGAAGSISELGPPGSGVILEN